jgi:hypothetical protein
MSVTSLQRRAVEPAPIVNLNPRERSRYSISRAILAAAELSGWPRVGDGGFEREVSDEIKRQLPSNVPRHGGFYIPTTTPLERAGLDTKTTGAGKELVYTDAVSFIDALRNRTVVLSLGATMLTGLRDNAAFPREVTPATASWVGENPGTDLADSNLTLDQIIASPKLLESTTSFSRKLLAQSTPSVDLVVLNDIAQINGQAVDRAALHGAGGLEPTGIYNLSGVNAVAMGGAITMAQVVALESAIGIANGETDPASLGYVTTPEIRARAKQVPELTGSPVRMWRGGMMNDARAEATNQVRKDLGVGTNEHGIIYGVWSEIIFCEWGAAEVIVDPFRLKKQGMIEVTSFLLADIVIRHPQSFAKGTGLTTA